MAALGAADYTELVASTIERLDENGKLHDQVLLSHPTLDLFRSKSKSANGTKLFVNLEAAEDDSTSFTDDSGTFDTGVSNDVVGRAEYDWSNPLVSRVRVIWKILQMNQGKEQIVDLLKTHTNAAMKGQAKRIARSLHARYDLAPGAGGPVAGQFYGFDAIVGDSTYDAANGLSVGGITPPDAGHYWNATRMEVPVDSGLSIVKAFRMLQNEVAVTTSSDANIDVLIAGRDIFEEFEDYLDDKVRYTDFGEGQTHFREIKHGDLTVRLDPDCPPKRAYFLDTSTWRLEYLNGNFMKTQPEQQLTGTLDFLVPIASVISVGTSQRRNNAVLLRPATAGGDA